MAITTSQVDQFECILEIDNASGSLVEISSVHIKTEVEFGVESKSTYVHGSRGVPTVSMKRTQDKITPEIIWSTASDEGKDLLFDWFFNTPETARTLRINIPDTATGSERFTAEVKMTKGPGFSTDASKADAMTIKPEFQTEGAPLARTIIGA